MKNLHGVLLVRGILPLGVVYWHCGKEQQCRTVSTVLERCIQKPDFLVACVDLSCKLQEQCFNTNLLECEKCVPASASHTFQKLKHLIARHTHMCSLDSVDI